MKANEYQATYELLTSQVRMLNLLPIDEFIAAIDHAETLGPLLDPTLWIKANEEGASARLRVIKEIAQHVRSIQAISKRAVEEERERNEKAIKLAQEQAEREPREELREWPYGA